MSEPTAGGSGTALTVTGVCCIVAGGLVAAVTGPLGLEHGSWLAAYLVLVGGVAQYAMGRAPLHLTGSGGDGHLGWATVASWNLGNVAVMAGTLVRSPPLVDVGALALVIGLVLALRSARGPVVAGRRVLHLAYRGLLVILLISIPIGILLAHVRNG